MEKTKNNSFREFFKNIGLALGKLVNEGEVDNDVPLTGELAVEPGKDLKNIISSEEYVKKSRARVANQSEKTTTRVGQTVNTRAKAQTSKSYKDKDEEQSR